MATNRPSKDDLNPDAPGPLFTVDGAADVYDLGDGTVLRRHRGEDGDLHLEARVMEYVRGHKYPVPMVHRVEGRDLVMERIDGPTMLEVLERSPWRLLWFARRLARLQKRLAKIPAPDWLLAPGTDAGILGGSPRVLHLDLHPTNIILSPRRGAHVIGWTNASGGPAGFDAALSYVTMATVSLFDDAPVRRLGRRFFVETFRIFRGRRLIAPYVVAACDHCLADRGTEPDQRVAVAELRTRHLARR